MIKLLPAALWLLITVSLASSMGAAVVINEVLYDAQGDDDGYEWIELYNNGDTNEQLEGATIWSAGQNWVLQYPLPAFILRPGRYLLIGGTNVPNTQLVYNFTFQNGGDETDGIRYVSPDGSYTDTVLYDQPNTNQLPDDTGNPATSFAPDVSAGYSLARVVDGHDTNACANDFISELNPTPGTANPIHSDYAIGSVELDYANNTADITIWLKNNSHFSPVDYATLSIHQLELLYDAEIPPIPPNDSVSVHATFTCTQQNLFLELSLPNDPNPENNTKVVSPVGGFTTGVVFSEFLADPDSGNQEWIELASYSEIPTREGVSIRDAAGNTTSFTWSGNEGYYVICRYKDQLLQRYPDCPPECVIEASSWASLNNDGDSLVLLSGGVVMDSIAYSGSEIIKGVSRERYIDDDWTLHWRNSYAASGGTPGLPNSTAPVQELPTAGAIVLSGSPCKASAGQSISLAYAFSEPSNRISCKVFDLRGSKVRTLADYALVGDGGILYWDGRKQDGSFVPRGLYIILWEAQAGTGGKATRQQLSCVISG